VALKIGIVADFNAENLARLISKRVAHLGATVSTAPFGQVMQALLDPSGEFWATHYDLVIVWTFPASVVPCFANVSTFDDWSTQDLRTGVSVFTDAIQRLATRASRVFVPTWVTPPAMSHRPSIEMQAGIGTAAALLQMNLWLVDELATSPGVALFNTERWVRHGGTAAFSDKLWFLSKTPFVNAVFDEAANDMVASLQGLMGGRKKVVILDLDNTIWGGIVGDVGWEGLQLGGHDPVGEAYAQFQKDLKQLSAEGVVLAIVSKNEESVALEAIERHPEMVLATTDFAAWRINWADKALNIAEVMAELNLGLDSAVFLDDSPHERSRVGHALPEVLVPEWPTDPLDFSKALRQLRCFEGSMLSKEDRARTQMYVSDRERRALRDDLSSVDEWLASLDLQMEVETLSPLTLERAAQLVNKTNQMNLTTRRMTAPGLAAWASGANCRTWTFRVKDKIGDYGLCGLASLTVDGARADLIDFVLSCRAMGRGVEDAIISVVATAARQAGANTMTVAYVPTAKNVPCLRWLEQHASITRGTADSPFELHLDRDHALPSHIRIQPSL
jgi:FkbH-like protein